MKLVSITVRQKRYSFFYTGILTQNILVEILRDHYGVFVTRGETISIGG